MELRCGSVEAEGQSTSRQVWVALSFLYCFAWLLPVRGGFSDIFFQTLDTAIGGPPMKQNSVNPDGYDCTNVPDTTERTRHTHFVVAGTSVATL